MKIKELLPWHLEALARQGVEGADEALQYCGCLKISGPCFAAYTSSGVVAAVGLICLSPGVYRCWALTDDVLAKKHIFALSKAMCKWLSENHAPRIETTVLKGNEKGRRWVMEILGFCFEGTMRNFYQGHDAGLYARIG